MSRVLNTILALSFLATSAVAQTQVHTNIGSFNDALPVDAQISILDFDSLNPGDLITSGDTIDGFGFEFDFGGVELRVGGGNTTSSTPNYLGTTDADVLQDGDEFTITFDPANAFGIHIVTADALEDNDIVLTFNGTAATVIALDIQQSLPDGSFVYFLGVTDSELTGSEATVSTIGGGFFLYNVDDFIRVEYPTNVVLGDVNLDGVVNLLDVDPFVERIATGTFQAEADCDQSGFVNLLDVDPFIAILSGG